MGIIIGIGNYIGKSKIISSGGETPIVDNVIISENASYIITENGLYIEIELIDNSLKLDEGKLDINILK